MIHRCPVCHRTVAPSAHGNIVGHVDTAGNTCEGTGQPFAIAELLTDSVKTTTGRHLRVVS